MIPVAFYHHALSNKEQGYDTNERELLAVVKACKKYRVYLDKTFDPITDHSVLKWLHSLDPKDHRHRLVDDVNKKRNLYVALVRTQFENCSQILHPNEMDNKIMLDKFKNFWTKCIKWILKEEEYSYHSVKIYNKCQDSNLLPMIHR